MNKQIKRNVLVHTVEIDGALVSWEIRETRTRRYYCYDHNGYCFDWSFMEHLAVQKLKRELAEAGGKIVSTSRISRAIKPDMRKNKDRRNK